MYCIHTEGPRRGCSLAASPPPTRGHVTTVHRLLPPICLGSPRPTPSPRTTTHTACSIPTLPYPPAPPQLTPPLSPVDRRFVRPAVLAAPPPHAPTAATAPHTPTFLPGQLPRPAPRTPPFPPLTA